MFRILFWLLLIVILVISQMPAENAPTVFVDDKMNHILAFFALAFLARIAWPRIDSFVLFLLLASFGGSIELLQQEMGFGRDADWMDLVADIAAILAGLLGANAYRSATAEPLSADDNKV